MITDRHNDVALITDGDALRAYVRGVQPAGWIALDTEFMRERTYFPQLCLVQVSDGSRIACIDPLAIDDLSSLTDLLTNTAVTKVLHAAFQDMEVLLQATGALPEPVFDTQVAAALLGHADQIGYARLVEAITGVQLEKAHSRNDWSRRPIDTNALVYAADDVRYLAQIYPLLRDQLSERGRLEWLTTEFADWTNPDRYRVSPQDAWRKVKGHRRLRPAQQQTLQLLAGWREKKATAADKPRKWIVKDDVLLEMARKRPGDRQALAKIRQIPDAVMRKHADTLLELCAQTQPEKPQPLARQAVQLSAQQQPVVDYLMAALRVRAADADINAGALASRKELEQLVAGERQLPVLAGWRRQAAGDFLLDILAGKKQLRSNDGVLQIRNDRG